MILLAVFLGGGIGSAIRFIFYIICNHFNFNSALATITVNCIGCLLIAYCSNKFANYLLSYHYLKPFLIAGFLGGFTTFSTFILDFNQLNYWQNYLYLTLSIILGIAFFQFGLLLSKL